MTAKFRALTVDQAGGKQWCEIRELPGESLPPGDVTIAVEYSSLNYKDGLAVTGTGKIIREFPMVPGIDLAGTIEASTDDAWQVGERVAVTGWGIGERYWGGYTQKNRVKAGSLVRLPAGMTSKQAMAIGTAGFTAMLCVMALELQGLEPPQGEVVVTGAAGGVGSVAVAILARLGYRVVASTGRADTHQYLKELGAVDIIDRSALGAESKKPLEAERWAGAVDSVGGVTLGNLIKTMKYGGSVAACGLASGTDLPTTVFPFILRNVSLLGVDSNSCPLPRRLESWKRLSTDLPFDRLEKMTQVIPLNEVENYSRQILAGKVRGRVVVDVNA